MEINDGKLFEKCNRYSTLNISNGCTISDDILNKINIESISQSELNEQYVDYVFARRFVPMGSRLYENNGIVKSTSTVEASDVVRDIKHKYNLQYWQIFVDNRKYNVKLFSSSRVDNISLNSISYQRIFRINFDSYICFRFF